MEKEIVQKIKELMSENQEIKTQLRITEDKLKYVRKMCDILFPLLFGMLLGICALIF